MKVDPKPSDAAFLTFFRDNFRPEVDSDVVSGITIEYVGADVCVKCYDILEPLTLRWTNDKRIKLADAGHHIKDIRKIKQTIYGRVHGGEN